MTHTWILQLAEFDEDGTPYNITRIQLGCPEMFEPLMIFAHGLGIGTLTYEADADQIYRSQDEIDRGQDFLLAFKEATMRVYH